MNDNLSGRSSSAQIHRRDSRTPLLVLFAVLTAAPAAGQSVVARFFCECDLGGVPATMQMDVEVIGTTGIVFGPGPTPDITGVIGTGDSIIYTAGEIRTELGGWFLFRGENIYADFTNMNTSGRFRARLIVDPQLAGRLWIVSDPTDLATQGEFAFPCTVIEAIYLDGQG